MILILLILDKKKHIVLFTTGSLLFSNYLKWFMKENGSVFSLNHIRNCFIDLNSNLRFVLGENLKLSSPAKLQHTISASRNKPSPC